nr:MAG TPA: hypothetical protein [Microviridae sp.]
MSKVCIRTTLDVSTLNVSPGSTSSRKKGTTSPALNDVFREAERSKREREISTWGDRLK